MFFIVEGILKCGRIAFTNTQWLSYLIVLDYYEKAYIHTMLCILITRC